MLQGFGGKQAKAFLRPLLPGPCHSGSAATFNVGLRQLPGSALASGQVWVLVSLF